MSSHGEPPNQNLFIVGEFGRGAFGPTIVLRLQSLTAARWLRDLFLEVRRPGKGLDLAANPRVRISGITQLRLDSDPGVGPMVRLRRIGREQKMPSFLWTGTSTGWAYEAGLIEPFVAGRTGHQYLTNEQTDDALVEVSLEAGVARTEPVAEP